MAATKAMTPAPINRSSLLPFDGLMWAASALKVPSSVVCPEEVETFCVMSLPALVAFRL